MGERGDRERDAARRELEGAEVERTRAEKGDAAAPVHRRAENRHRNAAATHERAARLFDAHDDPSVGEAEAIAIANEVLEREPPRD